MVSMLHLRLLELGWRESLDFVIRFNARSLPSSLPGARGAGARRNPDQSRYPYGAYRPANSSHATLRALRYAKIDTLRIKGEAFRILKYSALSAAVAIVLGMGGLVAGLVIMYEPPKSFEAKHLENARATITDNQGELVGAAPGFRKAPVDGLAVPDNESRMTAIIVHDVPPVWWDVAVALEDRRFGKFGWVYGIDVLALPHLLTGRGASTLPMQLAGNLLGLKALQYDEHGSINSKLRRKLTELASTPTLVASTSGDGYLWLKRLIATHLPVMHGQIGGSTVGIAGGSWVMYGKTPMELSVGEQAIFAAALKRNIYIRKQPDDTVKKAWAYNKERAKLGLKLAYPDPLDHRRISGLAEIDAMPDVPPLFFDANLPLSARAHVVHRRNFTARTAVVEAQAELKDRYGLKQLEAKPIRGYKLTLNSKDNFHFKQKMDKAAEELTQKLARECRLFLPLTPNGFEEALFQRVTGKPNCAPADLPKTERAQVLAVLANENGEIIRYYQSGSEESIYAGVMGRAGNDGRYDPREEIRDVGSVAKIGVALLLASMGDKPQDRYCRLSFDGRLDSDGTTGFSNCNVPGAMIEAREAFARSSTLAILWRLRQIPKIQLQKLAADLGLKLPSDVEPAYALAYGQVRASPRQIHNLMHITGKLALGRPDNGAQSVHVVQRLEAGPGYKPFDILENNNSAQVSLYLRNPEASLFVQDVLGAVLAHQHGTMRFLKAFTTRANTEITAHLGKTGTPVNASKAATDKFMTGSLIFGGKYYSYLIAIRAPNPGKYPLGKRLWASHFAPLATTLLNEIQALSESQDLKRAITLKAQYEVKN